MTANRILVTALLAAFSTVAASANSDDIDEMRRIKIIKGMTSYTTANGPKKIFTYEFDLVGRALISRGNGVCDYKENTLTGYQDIEMTKEDISNITAKVPIIEKLFVTGMCDGLQKKHFGQ